MADKTQENTKNSHATLKNATLGGDKQRLTRPARKDGNASMLVLKCTITQGSKRYHRDRGQFMVRAADRDVITELYVIACCLPYVSVKPPRMLRSETQACSVCTRKHLTTNHELSSTLPHRYRHHLPRGWADWLPETELMSSPTLYPFQLMVLYS
jgi:hypothetical protein